VNPAEEDDGNDYEDKSITGDAEIGSESISDLDESHPDHEILRRAKIQVQKSM
jgi:hypothetical protein